MFISNAFKCHFSKWSFFQFPLRVICLLWKFTAVLYFIVKLYKFKFESFSRSANHCYSFIHFPPDKGYHGPDMLHEREKKKWRRLLKLFFKIIVILIRNCALQIFSLNFYYSPLLSFEKESKCLFASRELLYLLAELALGLAFSYVRFCSVS